MKTSTGIEPFFSLGLLKKIHFFLNIFFNFRLQLKLVVSKMAHHETIWQFSKILEGPKWLDGETTHIDPQKMDAVCNSFLSFSGTPFSKEV